MGGCQNSCKLESFNEIEIKSKKAEQENYSKSKTPRINIIFPVKTRNTVSDNVPDVAQYLEYLNKKLAISSNYELFKTSPNRH